MAFGFDLKKIFFGEALKTDLNKNGTPDVLEACDALEAGIDAIKPFTDRLDNAFLRRLVQAVNFDGFLNDDEIVQVAGGFEQVIKALPVVKSGVEALEAELKKAKK